MRSTYKLAKAGELPGAAKFGIQWGVRRDILLEWAAQQVDAARKVIEQG